MTSDDSRPRVIYDGDLLIQLTPVDIVPVEGGEGFADADKAEALVNRLDALGTQIGRVCRTLHAKALDAIKDAKPDELELEFGVQLGGEIGIPMVSKGKADCDVSVKATWKFSPAP
ncbi:CU044_2847 family protein (plasmid) [Mycolicibacterium psychrotolerans]|uniref:CU044_2847 family protein n=1 Tax=Mycolicibacterium psychrotolerans TaxID=216929 RepID=UPI003D677DEF